METINAVKDSLQRLMDVAESGAGAAHLAALRKVANVVAENEGKIWMKTRVGRPLLEQLLSASERLNRALRGADEREIEEALRALEAGAEAISEESRRRSMVVT